MGSLARMDNPAEVDERAALLIPEHETRQADEGASAAVIWTVFPILLAGIFLSNAVSSVIIATNQHIASEFDASSSAAWLLTIYTLAQSSSQPLYGKLSDIYGRRACLAFCWSVFGVGCSLVALGQSYWQVLFGRAIGGIGSAGKIALTSIVVADLVPLRNVAQYRAYVNLTATMARSLGGPIGGWLAGSVGWRWCFRVQLPVALAGLAILLRTLPNSPPDTKNGIGEKPKLSRVDFAGAFTLVGAVLTGLLSLDLASKGFGTLYVGSIASSFLIFVGLFIFVEKYHAKEPVLPLTLVSKPDVLTAYSIVGLQSAGQFGESIIFTQTTLFTDILQLLYLIPIYFQVVSHESVSSTGLRIVPVVVGNALGTIISGSVVTKTKKYKNLTACGNIIGFTGFLLMLLRWHGDTQWYDALLVSLPGVGMGIIQSTTFVHLAASLGDSEIAIAGTAWFLAQNVGILVGASLSTALINTVLETRLQAYLDILHNRNEVIRRILASVSYVDTLPDTIRLLVTKAYVEALLSSVGLSLILVFAGFLCTMIMREKPL